MPQPTSTTEPGFTTEDQRSTLVDDMDSMRQGWGGSFEVRHDYLDELILSA